ncbi:MAG: hypothetical protein K6D90_09220 [Lachnospiraceae bacterium]|nr:hypothetical protein [Lachnospiraceae bacterium]
MSDVTNRKSDEDLKQAMSSLAEATDEEKENNPWIIKYHDLPSYQLNVTRDGSEDYFKALTEAILAITKGEYGSIDYKGFKIYYNDTPHVHSISLEDGHMEYGYETGFRCEALSMECYEEYHSEEERMAFLDPENALFKKTLALLDKEIEYLDEGTWIKEKKKLNIYDFKDYAHKNPNFKKIEWDDRNKDASTTFSHLMEHASMKTTGLVFTEDDFKIFAEVIRRMVFFADYGNDDFLGRCDLQGFVMYEWKPETKRDRYIWRCMDEFGQFDLPDNLLNNCALYYLVDDPQGWEALAYLLPITALWIMCEDYEPDSVKKELLDVFDLIPDNGYKDRVEKMIEEDRKNATMEEELTGGRRNDK